MVHIKKKKKMLITNQLLGHRNHIEPLPGPSNCYKALFQAKLRAMSF